MPTALWIVAALLLALHLYRRWWMRRELPRVGSADFEGELFRVDATVIARRPARGDSDRTIVCFPGFLEDMRYFQALYEDAECELILVNNANYHSAFPAAQATALDCPANPFELGTIEYDGFYLAQVLRELATGDEVVLHGHSRGGAVVLETGRQFPRLVKEGGKTVSAILEAPVLPGARVVGSGSDPLPHYLIRYFLPLVLGLSRDAPLERLLKQPMMQPTNDLKNTLCQAVYTNPRQYRTCVVNVRSIRDWQRLHGPGLYANYTKVTVVMGERDDVLDNASMLASAEAGAELNSGVEVLRTENTNHFPSLEQPHYIRDLVGIA